ncbi:MAG: hypothetical protein DMD40_16215 [Gemmatimonadetes bacterium]|nr:MAG: hypothetical protein DMD40_16215 [Gemmatimonadota bacterium]
MHRRRAGPCRGGRRRRSQHRATLRTSRPTASDSATHRKPARPARIRRTTRPRVPSRRGRPCPSRAPR